MQVPFSRPFIPKSAISEVSKTLESGWLTTGKKTEEFESLFAQKVESKYAVALNSATAGLHLSLAAIGLTNKDAVITTSVTFFATVEVICYFGAEPILTDINPKTNLMDKKTILDCINTRCIVKKDHLIDKKTKKAVKAIIPVHLAGLACNMEEILEIAKKYNLYVIEDAAHSFPASYREKMIGSFGDLTVFSFHATKNLTTGEGGMVTTDNELFSNKLKLMRLHGMNRDSYQRSLNQGWFYEIVTLGYKYNMSDIMATIGIEQLKEVDILLKNRKAIVNLYLEELSQIPCITLPALPLENSNHAWHLFRIEIDGNLTDISRDALFERLKLRDIQTSLHFIPIYEHPYFKENYFYEANFLNASIMYQKTLSLPLFSSMKESEALYVVKCIKEIFNS